MKTFARAAAVLCACLFCCPLIAQVNLNISQLSSLYDFWAEAVDVEISGDLAYVSTVETGLYILDISDPSDPIVVCHYIPPGYVFDVKVVGGYAYIAQGSLGLCILDVSDPAIPVLVGERRVYPDATEIDISGNYAYIAARDNLRIYDVSDVSNPVQVSHIDFGTQALVQDVQVVGRIAYVADEFFCLRLIDISDPEEPVEISTCSGENGANIFAYEVTVRDNLAFVACLEHGLQIIDVSTPAAPFWVGSYESVIDCLDAAVCGDTVYIADHNAGMKAIDVSDPSSPVLRDIFQTLGVVFAVTIVDDIAYVADKYAGLRIVDIANESYLQELGYSNEGLVCEVVYQNSYAYVAMGFDGLNIIDVSDPVQPVVTGVLNTDRSQVFGLRVVGNHAYLANWDDGLQIMDVSNPANPTLISEFDTPGFLGTIAVSGSFAYLGLKYNGLEIVDISNPEIPVSRSFLQLDNDEVDEIEIADTLAYIANYGGGLRIIDVSNPNLPQEIGVYEDAVVHAVCLADTLCYITSNRGFRILDISNPTSPELLTVYNELEGVAYDINIDGDYAFLATGDEGIYVVDVSNLDSIFVSGFYDTNAIAASFVTNGNYSYLAEGYHFSIYDHSAAITEAGSVLSGTVYDSCTDQPIAGTEITLSDYYEYTTETDAGGHYRFNVLFPLTYTVTISVDGFAAYEDSVTVEAGTNEHDFGIMPAPDLAVIADESYEFAVPYMGGAVDSFVIRNASVCSAELEFQVLILEDNSEGRPLNQDWIAVSVDNGTLSAGEQIQIQIIIDASLDSLNGETRDCFLVVQTNDPDDGWYGAWVYLTVEAQSANESVLPTEFSVSPPYPNPFNPSVTIPFSLPSAGLVGMTIYNIMGQTVYSMENIFPAGSHQVLLDAQSDGMNLSSGLYFLQVRYLDEVRRCRLLLMK